MRIMMSVAGILLIAAVAVAQDETVAAAVAPVSSKEVALVAVEMDEDAVAEYVRALEKHAVVTTVSVKMTQNKKGEKAQALKILTEQDKDDPFVGIMRFTIEMRDGTNMWYGQQMVMQEKQKKRSSAEERADAKAKAEKKKSRSQGKKAGSKAKQTETAAANVTEAKEAEIDYTGEDSWTFKIPMGKGETLKRPEIRAYAAEYGFLVKNKTVSNQFVIVSSKYKNAENADQILARNQGNPNVLKTRMTGKALREGEGEAGEGEGGGGGGGGGGRGGGGD